MRSCKWFPHTSKMLTWTYKLVNCIAIKNFMHKIFKLRGTIWIDTYEKWNLFFLTINNISIISCRLFLFVWRKPEYPKKTTDLPQVTDKPYLINNDREQWNSFVCNSHFMHCLIKELGIGNSTYTPSTLTKNEILDNHRFILCSFGI